VVATAGVLVVPVSSAVVTVVPGVVVAAALADVVPGAVTVVPGVVVMTAAVVEVPAGMVTVVPDVADTVSGDVTVVVSPVPVDTVAAVVLSPAETSTFFKLTQTTTSCLYKKNAKMFLMFQTICKYFKEIFSY